MEKAVLGLKQYISISEKTLIKAAEKVNTKHYKEAVVEYKMRQEKERIRQWREKTLHRQVGEKNLSCG